MPTLNCPSREMLQGFALGDLPDAEIEAVTDHLESCTECEQTVALFEEQSDTFISRLRTPVVKSRFADEPEFQRAVAAANAVARQPFIETQEAAEPQDKPLGRLGEYQLLARLGHGGMGTVYKAWHTRLRRGVALKVLPTHRRHEPAVVERFGREIEAVGTLSHPNIVTAHDAGEEEGVHYLVMELVEGVDLHTLVGQVGPLPVADACEIIRQAACGLQHAHEHALVHRDLKPSNLLLSRDGQVKVLDLGLALLQGKQAASEHLTSTGQVMGTLDYMAPEQADDSHGVDARADVYSLGCTLYKLLSGQAPFRAPQYDTPAKKIMAHAQVAPPPIQSQREDLPDELAELLGRMLAKDPAQRPATPAEVAAALEPLAEGSDPAALAAQVKDMPAQDSDAASADEIPVMLRDGGFAGGRPHDRVRDRRPPNRAWLWLGWALVATACICLGLTMASMDTAYRMTADGPGSASGLAQGISGSLRYLPVGVPAFLAGVIVLVVSYVRRFAADLRPRRWRLVGQIAVIACAVLLGGIALGQIVIRIQHGQGTETVVKAPAGSEIEIDDKGEVAVTLPSEAEVAVTKPSEAEVAMTLPSEAEKKIEAALRGPTTLEFIETPLEDIVDYLKDLHQIEVQIDTRALEVAGKTPTTPLTRNLKGISLGSALSLMLGEENLTYRVIDEVLLITTPAAFPNHVYSRVYPVSDLLAAADAPGPAEKDCAALGQLIQEVVFPENWNTVGGAGVLVFVPPGAPKAVIVQQHRKAHEAVARLLAMLHDSAHAEPGAEAAPVNAVGAAEKQIADALDAATRLEFIETPLPDVVDYLKDFHQIEIQVDTRALQQAKIRPDVPITRNVKGISLRSALRLMLHEVNLTTVVCDEVLLVTTPEEALKWIYVRVYPVGDLLDAPEGERSAERDCAAIAKLIQEVACPNEWDDVGGHGALKAFPAGAPKHLVVLQDRQGHAEVTGLLGLLRTAARLQPGSGPLPIDGNLPAEKQIAKALDSTTALDFVDVRLEDVVDYLKDRHEIEIQIDRKALANVGVDTDTPITRDLKNVTLRSALRLILREIDLTYVIRDEVLLITNPEEAEDRLIMKLYPIRDLVPAGLKTLAARKEYAEKLIKAIQDLVQPASWDRGLGPGSVSAVCLPALDALLVTQTEELHHAVSRLLTRPEMRP